MVASWLAGIAIIAIIETTLYLTFRPGIIDRSDFLTAPFQRFFKVPAERWIIWSKLREPLAKDSVAVTVGDSSGLFGIMPDVVAPYIGGQKVLNLNCCGNQGFHGYLALLELALREHPSIRYAIAYVSPHVPPTQDLWPSAKPGEVTFANQSFSVFGDVIHDSLLGYRRFLYPPSNSLRLVVNEALFTQGHGSTLEPQHRQPNAVYSRANVLTDRLGYMIEHDIQTVFANECLEMPVSIESGSGRAYWDLFAEALVTLGRKYGVTPVLMFHPTPTLHCDKNKEARNLIDGLRARYPTLRIPYDFLETWPEVFFAVPQHVQRSVAVETSRRLGRALAALKDGATRAPDLRQDDESGSRALMRIVGARLVEQCGWGPDYKDGYFADVTPVFRERCDGRGSCEYQKGSDARDPDVSNKACKSVYVVDYHCSGQPVRSVREEGRGSFGGTFRLSCGASSYLAQDPVPYGIHVVHATSGAADGGVIGNATTPLAARCDGLAECLFTVERAKIGDRSEGPGKSIDIVYRCDRELASRIARIEKAEEGSTIRLSCLPMEAQNEIISLDTTPPTPECTFPGGYQYVAASLCEGKATCRLPTAVFTGKSANSKCAIAETAYRCSSTPAVVRRSDNGTMSCAAN